MPDIDTAYSNSLAYRQIVVDLTVELLAAVLENELCTSYQKKAPRNAAV